MQEETIDWTTFPMEFIRTNREYFDFLYDGAASREISRRLRKMLDDLKEM